MRQFHCNRKWTKSKLFENTYTYLVLLIDLVGLEEVLTGFEPLQVIKKSFVLRGGGGGCLGPVDGWRDSTTYANNTLFDNLMS